MSNAARKARKSARQLQGYPTTVQAEYEEIEHAAPFQHPTKTPTPFAQRITMAGQSYGNGISAKRNRRHIDALVSFAAEEERATGSTTLRKQLGIEPEQSEQFTADVGQFAGAGIELDPTPFVRDGERYATAPGRFRPRSGYSQDRADYTTGA